MTLRVSQGRVTRSSPMPRVKQCHAQRLPTMTATRSIAALFSATVALMTAISIRVLPAAVAILAASRDGRLLLLSLLCLLPPLFLLYWRVLFVGIEGRILNSRHLDIKMLLSFVN